MISNFAIVNNCFIIFHDFLVTSIAEKMINIHFITLNTRVDVEITTGDVSCT